MPFVSIGREVVRGTICKDRWLAQITLMCSDHIAPGVGSPLFLAIEWRDERDDPEIPDQPDDAKPIVLTLKKRSSVGSGEVRFDSADGPATKGFTGETRTVLTLFGRSASAGTVADIDLEIRVEDEVRGTIPLMVGEGGGSLRIMAENGTDPAPSHVIPGEAFILRAAVDPAAAGSYRWVSIDEDRLEIRGSTAAEAVEVVAHPGGEGERQIMVLFTPAGGPAVMAAHLLQLANELTYTGRLLDTIGLPIAGADVTVERYNGDLLSETAVTAGDGTFEVRAPLHPELRVVLRHEGEVLALRQSPTIAQMVAPIALGDLHMRIPISLSGPVVDGAASSPENLARIQDRLLHLGRLTPADVAAEPINPTSANPVDIGTMPLLLGALGAHLRAGLGRRLLEVHPSDPTLDVLNADPIFPLVPITLGGAVGEEPGTPAPVGAINARRDVRAVQDRLHQLGFLSTAAYRAERIDPAGAPANVAAGTIPLTLGAIRSFDSNVTLGSLPSIAPGREGAARLADPYLFGLSPLKLQGSVGEGAENRPGDVRLIQDRLHTLGFLADADFEGERVADPGAGQPTPPVEESALPRTIAALRAAHTARVGPPLAAGDPIRLELDDPALTRLNHPPRVDLRSGVGEGEAGVVANHAADVRAVQDRLRLLNFLDQADYDDERVNPHRDSPVAAGSIPQTIAALALFRQSVLRGGAAPDPGAPAEPGRVLTDDRPPPLLLSGSVGPGGENARADVRAVQDRLRALRFLQDADHQREAIDPARSEAVNQSVLTSTFAAIRTLQQRVLQLPPEVAGQEWTAQGVIRPDEASHRLLADPLFYGREKIGLKGAVGEAGWNRRAEVRAIQDRLKEMRFLSEAHHAAEAADPVQVDAAGRAPVADSALIETRRAIARLRENFLGEPAPGTQRIEVASPLLVALRNPLLRTPRNPPLAALWRNLELSASVGAAGTNRGADVRAVQDRFRDLGFLSAADRAAERPVGNGVVADASLPRTIASIERWQRRMLGAAGAGGLIEPLDASNRLLARPILPRPVTVALTDRVGAGASVNRHPGVRRVQDRLHEIGLLSTASYVAERVPSTGGGTAPAATIPQTVAAIQRFQRTASGGVDGVIDVGGMTERTLNDPTHGTPTLPNPNTDYRNAGPAMPAFPRALQQIILAIERHEAGGSTGEVPAILRNGSDTPASYGKAQVIGATGVGTLRGDAAFAAFYLDAGDLTELRRISDNMLARYNAIYALVPAPGLAEAALQAAIGAYIPANLQAFRAETGLGEQDIVRCFRTAQFRRQCAAFISGQPVPAGTAPNNVNAARRSAAEAAVGALLNDADVQATVNVLGFQRGDVRAYLRRAIDGEHRAGFITRALLHSKPAQKFRNALTDDSGFKIGRFVIQDNFNAVNAAAAGAGVALTDLQRAQIVARVHNSGPAGINGWVNNPASAVNSYVNNVMPHWVP